MRYRKVAHALNCPTNNDNDLALCLRNRDLEVLLNVKIAKPRYVPAYAPLIDRAVIPRKPLTLMENAQLFGRFVVHNFLFYFFSFSLVTDFSSFFSIICYD